MSIFAKGLVAAMEDETQAAELAIDESGADSAEADIVEATDISADVEAGTAEVEQASADAETLTRIADTAEAAEEEGGLDPVAAEIAEIAVESIYARLGVQRQSYPALESFSGKTGRKRATQIAVEDIKETVKKIWAAVVVAFQKMVDFVKNFFAKIFDANRKLLSRINSLEKQTRNLKLQPGGKVKASGVISQTDAKTKEEALKAIEATPGEIEAMFRASADVAEGMREFPKIKELLAGDGDLKALSIKKLQDAHSKFTMIARDSEGAIGKKFELATADKDLNPDLKVPEFKFEFKNPFSSEGKELDALKTDEIQKVLKAAETIVKLNIGSKTLVSALEASMKVTIEAAKKVSETVDDKDGNAKNVTEGSRVAQRLITSTGNSAIKVVTFTAKTGMDVAKAAIDYVERSVKASGGEDVKEEKKEEAKK